MAEQTTGRGKAKPAASPDDERTPTRRVILKRERVLVLPESFSLTNEEEKALVAELKKHGIKDGNPRDAWLVVGEQTGASKRDAIEGHAGKAGTPDALPGDYKAPPASGFSGGERYVRPEKPKVERETLED